MAPGEEVVLEGKAKYGNTPGMLFCTSQKVAFEYERGLISKSRSIPVNVPLSAVTMVSIGGVGPFRKLSIQVNTQIVPGPARYEFGGLINIEKWQGHLNMTLSGRSPFGGTATPIPRPTTVQAKKCTGCGQLAEAHVAFCPVCGTRIV